MSVEATRPAMPLDPVALEAASRWMVRLQAGAAASELPLFHAWLAEHPDHLQAMQAVTASWEISAALPVLPEFRATQAADRVYFSEQRTFLRRNLRPALAAVSALLVLTGAALLWQAETRAPVIYATGPSERLDVQLADGSQIRLDTQTRVAVRMLWRRRELVLERGGAEFQVAHEAWRPFTVATPRIVVRALGTDFEVRRDGDDTSVVLLSGAVDLRTPDTERTEARLVPNQKAFFAGLTAAPELRQVNARDEVAWRSGQIVLNRTRLADALRRFARYTATEIKLAPELADMEVGGIYRTDELLTFLNGIARVQPVAWRRDETGAYVVTRR